MLELQQLVSMHGYWVVALIVGLESLGLPLPGETILVLAAIYAATEPSFNIWMLIVVAAFGAIVGDNLGYWLGLRYGYALLLRYGDRIGMFEARIKLGAGCCARAASGHAAAAPPSMEMNSRRRMRCPRTAHNLAHHRATRVPDRSSPPFTARYLRSFCSDGSHKRSG